MTLFFNGIVALCGMAMHAVGAVDDSLGVLMTGAGITPQYQVMIMLVATAALVVFVLRALGGLLGWLVFLLLILLLIHRLMPAGLPG
jgi:hypothetical protein